VLEADFFPFSSADYLPGRIGLFSLLLFSPLLKHSQSTLSRNNLKPLPIALPFCSSPPSGFLLAIKEPFLSVSPSLGNGGITAQLFLPSSPWEHCQCID